MYGCTAVVQQQYLDSTRTRAGRGDLETRDLGRVIILATKGMRRLCCVAPTSVVDPFAALEECGDDVGDGGERTGLESHRVSALAAQARAEGVDDIKVDEALDSNNPKAALISLILSVRRAARSADAARSQALETQLKELGVSSLRKRAAACGVDSDSIDQALDSSSPKHTLIQLILSAPSAPTPGTSNVLPARSKPHFGPGNNAIRPLQRSTKHVMLSYQWDHQRQVKRVHELLTQLGLKVWMDINGGMGVDVYESMAEAVSNASVVVCFMSQKYQESPNCMLEAKFAKQSGIEVVPVLMEGDGWKASGWLGLVTAGSLWVPLHEEASFEENVRMLHGQLLKIVGEDGADVDAAEESDSLVLPHEAKEELERLRESHEAAQSTVSMVLADPTQPATIPAGVPKLPARFHATREIQTLTRLVLSTSPSDMAKSRVGFFGMGGIGKTVTGAAIVRNEDVRLHFDAIVWLPLGQTPVIAKLQNLCHMQCTGRELSSELSSEEKKEALQQAMAGKKILLCLDDLWEDCHETELSFADVGAGSKVLISTRMKGLLVGGHQVEVGLPSASDSARMLLAAAGVEEAGVGSAPSGVGEIVDLCGRLPLALGIAGRLAASLGLVGAQDWSDMIGVLKEELRESHSGGTEEGMIRASLRGLKGSAQEQQNVKAMLLMFALVPEDTHCPLEVLLLMFKATADDGSSTATIMHIRKWLRVLIDRSLVLGTIDRPSVHDLVLDFAVAQHSAEELREKHRRVVEAFRAARPINDHGLAVFDRRTMQSTAVSKYVCEEVDNHLTVAVGNDFDQSQESCNVKRWMSDVPQDVVVLATGRILGIERTMQLASAAENVGDWWLAARYWAVLCKLVCDSSIDKVIPTAQKSMAAISKYLAHNEQPSAELLRSINHIQLDQLRMIGTQLDISALAPYMELMEPLMQSQAAKDDPVGATTLSLFVSAQALFGVDKVKAGEVMHGLYSRLRHASLHDPEPITRTSCLYVCYAIGHHFCLATLFDPTLDFDYFFGTDGDVAVDAVVTFDYDAWHEWLIINNNIDSVTLWGCGTFYVAAHYGNLKGYYRSVDKSLECMERAINAPDQTKEFLGTVMGLPTWALTMYIVEAPQRFRVTIAKLMDDYNLTWSAAGTKVGKLTQSWFRKTGDNTVGQHVIGADALTWYCRAAHVLVAGTRSMSKQELLDGLPTVPEMVHELMTMPACSIVTSSVECFQNPLMSLAALCCELDDHSRALAYLEAALSKDLSQAGCGEIPSTRAVGCAMQGRAFAALGRIEDAAAAFEAAAATAHRYKLWLFEAYALRDLKLLVLDQMGHGEHGARRLGAVLRLLIGPAELLTPMLKGLDAAELMALAAPEAGYEVVYSAEDAATAELRRELQKLKLMELHKRALSQNVSLESIEDAMESDQPKAELVELLVGSVGASLATDHARRQELREELSELRLMALHTRALGVGVDSGRLEDAMEGDNPKSALIELIVMQPESGQRESTPSANRPEAGFEVVYSAEDKATAELRRELEGLRLKALRQKAREHHGIDDSELEDAIDADDPKAAVIALVLTHHANAAHDEAAAVALAGPSPEAQRAEAMRAELEGLGLKELRRRARAAGADEEALEDATDAEEPKAAVTALLMGLVLAEGADEGLTLPEGVPP